MTKHSPSKSGASSGSNGTPSAQEMASRIAVLETALSSRAADPASAQAPASVNTVAIDSVAVKLPGFWKDNPRGWFHQAELAFEIRNPAIVVSRTKYGHVVTALDSAASTEIQHVLDDPPSDDPYSAIKEALLIAYDQTQAAKDAEFLSLTYSGDLKATAMLRKMMRLTSPSTASTTIFRHSFLMVLPSDVRGILATLGEPIDVLAKKANAIIEARGTNSVASIDSSPSLTSLAQEVAALRLSVGRQNRNRGSTPAASQDPFVCYNHTKWGLKAYSCKTGCSFANAPLGARPGNANASR